MKQHMRDKRDEVYAVAAALPTGGTSQQRLEDAQVIVEELEWQGYDIVKVEE